MKVSCRQYFLFVFKWNLPSECDMRIFFLTGTMFAAIPMDEKEQYERTLSKRHPNRGREELQAMAEEHLGASSSSSIQPDSVVIDWKTATL